jgi:hypothetical protein
VKKRVLKILRLIAVGIGALIIAALMVLASYLG